MISPEKLSQLREARTFGIGRLFLLARRDFSFRLTQKMNLNSPQGRIPGNLLLPFLELEGTRSTELAKRAGISKQAVVKMLKELEEAGLIFRVADHTDGRAQLVRFTEDGVSYLLKMHAAIKSIEQEYEQLLGADQLQDLRNGLSQLAYSRDLIEFPLKA